MLKHSKYEQDWEVEGVARKEAYFGQVARHCDVKDALKFKQKKAIPKSIAFYKDIIPF